MAKDFFISYAASDSAWAEWIAWQLEEAHYSTVLQAWDFSPGSNFILEIDRAAQEAKTTLAILSEAYLERLFTKSEWASAFARDPVGEARSLLPIRVGKCKLGGLLAQVVYVDLVGLDEGSARRKLLEKLAGGRGKPSSSPSFPGGSSGQPVVFPGSSSVGSSDILFATRGFVCARLTASGLLDLDLPENPYVDALDPSDDSQGRRLRVFAALWLPSVEYVQAPMHKLTPVASVCTLDPERVLGRAQEVSRRFVELLSDKHPRDMRNDCKEEIIAAMGYALRDSFVAAVTIPSIVLGVGRKEARMGYQTILDLFLFPLLETHCQIGFREFHIYLPSVGDIDSRGSVLKIAKRMIAALSTARRGTRGTVDFVSQDPVWLAFVHMARFLTWMAGAYYNHRNEKWLLLFREALESQAGG